MRLTLHTMLAYLDDVLEPADAAILGEKIKESEFASKLISRIRTVVRKQRLMAPPIDGKGMGQDPNSVAEYLDSELAPEREPEFEKICLESDGHLAEVAACHQILTLVLGKPAKVPSHLRDRVYRYGSNLAEGSPVPSHPAVVPATGAHRQQHAHAATSQAGVDLTSQPGSPTTSTDPVHATPVGRRDEEEIREVPQYLRDGRRRSQLVAFAVSACVLLLLVGLGYLAARQFFPSNDVAQADPSENPSAEVPAQPEAPDSTSAEAVSPAESDDQPPVDPANQGTPPQDTPPTDTPPTETPAVEGSGTPAAEETPSASPAASQPDTGEAEVPDTIDIPPRQVPPENPAVTEDPVESLPSKAGPASSPSEPPATSVADANVPTPMPEPAPLTDANPPASPAEATASPAEVSPVDVGRYLSGDKVLARLNPQGEWLRLPANTPIRSGNQVLSLPANRPQIALTSGITLTLDGATRLQFLRPGEEDRPQVALKYGHLLAISVAKQGSTMGLTVGNVEGTVRLVDTNTMLAVQATPLREPGADPETHRPELAIELICLTGRVDWIADLGNAVAITAGEQYTMRDTGIGQIEKFEAPPAWVDDKSTTLPDRDAASQLEQRLVADRSLALTLSEIASGPRGDLRSLAVRSLAYMDNHDYFSDALSDASQRSSWAAELDAVKHALARSPQAAAAVRKALEKDRGASAKGLYRLTWGYSPEDLATGADAKLVEYLDHEAQDFRVLAIENLRRITGATHLYRPEYSAQRRKMYVQTWRKDLEEGKIRYPGTQAPGS